MKSLVFRNYKILRKEKYQIIIGYFIYVCHSPLVVNRIEILDCGYMVPKKYTITEDPLNFALLVEK